MASPAGLATVSTVSITAGRELANAIGHRPALGPACCLAPAPQQKPRSLQRRISIACEPGTDTWPKGGDCGGLAR